MNYVNSLNNLGLEMRQLPCFPGKGAPTTETEGAVGDLYMDTDTGIIYKCVAVSGSVYTWESTETGDGTTEGNTIIGYKDIAPTIETGYEYLDDGRKTACDTSACTEIIPVQSGEKFLITSAYGWATVFIVEFDENGKGINYVGKASSKTVVEDYEYTVPDGVFGIGVNTYLYSQYPISVKKGYYGSLRDDVAKNSEDIAKLNKDYNQRMCTAKDNFGSKVGNGFAYDYNSTIAILIDLLKKATFDEDVKSKIEALELSVYADVLKLPANTATGTYTLKYEDANGVIADYLDICTFTVDSVAQKIAYNGFIAENTAPKTATKIGVYNASNERVSEIALGWLNRFISGWTPTYTFAAVSDTHVGEDGAAEDFADATAYFDNNNIAFAAVCGDCVDDARETSQLEAYQSVVENVQTPIYVVMGNHEAVNMDVSGEETDISGNYASISQYFKQNAHPNINQELYYSFEKNGDVFIMVGAYGNYNYGRTFSNEELQWLYETLEANRNKRCFLFHHYFPKNGSGDAVNCYAKNDGLRGVQGEIFYSLLRHYKNVLYFHGHSHAKFSAQELNRYNTIDKEYGMYSIHIPSLSKPKYPNATQDEYVSDTNAGEGYIVDVYSTGVHLKGRDFENNKFSPIGTYWLDTTLQTIEAGTFYDETGTINIE